MPKKKEKIKEEIAILKQEKTMLENSVQEIRNLNSKIIPDEVMKDIVDRNFSKMYDRELNNYSNQEKESKQTKKKYRMSLLHSFLPLIISTGIALSTIGGYAIYHRNDLEAFTKYHGYKKQYTITYIDNVNNTWGEPIQLTKNPGYDLYITVKIPLEDDLVTTYSKAISNTALKYADLLEKDPASLIGNYVSRDSQMIRKDPSIIEPVTEVGVAQEIKSDYITSDIKEDDLQMPGYKKLSITSAALSAIGIIVSGIVSYCIGLNYDRKEYMETKQNLTIQKRKMKYLSKRKR